MFNLFYGLFFLTAFWGGVFTTFIQKDYSRAHQRLIASQTTKTSDGPTQLACRLQPESINGFGNALFMKCLVKSNDAMIDNVILNRGNCPSPTDTLSPEDFVTEVKKIPPKAQQSMVDLINNLQNYSKIMQIMTLRQSTAIINILPPKTQEDIEAKKLMNEFYEMVNNPKYNLNNDHTPNTYHFGDSIDFLFNCQNLIEMEIDTTDGQSLKYTFQ